MRGGPLAACASERVPPRRWASSAYTGKFNPVMSRLPSPRLRAPHTVLEGGHPLHTDWGCRGLWRATSSRGKPTRASSCQDPWPTCATTSTRWSRRWAAQWSCRSTTPGRPGASPRPRCAQCSRTCWSGPHVWAGPGPSAPGGQHGCPQTLQDVPWARDSGESPCPQS